MALHLQVLFLLGTASLLHATCPFVPVMANFDPGDFSGKWYQVERLNTGWVSTISDDTISCLDITFTETGNGSFSAVSNWIFGLGRYFLPTSMDSNFIRISKNFPNYFQTGRVPWFVVRISFSCQAHGRNREATAGGLESTNPENTVGLTVYHQWLPLLTTTFYVLDTDYNKYAIVYTCTDLGIGLDPIEMSWILHRKKIGLTTRRRKNIFEALPTNPGINFIDTSEYSRISFDGCNDSDGPTGNLTTLD